MHHFALPYLFPLYKSNVLLHIKESTYPELEKNLFSISMYPVTIMLTSFFIYVCILVWISFYLDITAAKYESVLYV